MDLTELGWDDSWAAAFAANAAPGLEPARVAIEFNHIFRVITAAGELQVQHAGRLLHRASGRHALAAVGDWVGVQRTAGEMSGTIEHILPRRTRFSRKVAGDLTLEQVVAANIDVVFLVMGLDGDFNPRRLERYLLLAADSGAQPVIVLSKTDLAPDLDAQLSEITRLAPQVPIHPVTALVREIDGTTYPPALDVLTAHLGKGRTGALMGSSGVGKSTIINALIGTAALKTGDVRARDSRGRHTTRHRQLIVLPGRGLLIDTPGMRELQLWNVSEASAESFDEIDALAADCHFTDCRHRDEPRCAVKAAVADGRLAAERLASFVKLQEEARALDARRDERAHIEDKRRGRVMGKSLKQLYKARGR